MNLVIDQNNQLSDAVQSVLGQLLHNVDSSKTVHKLGLETELTKFISTLIANPIKAQLQSHSNTFANLEATVDVVMNLFFKEKAHLLNKVFKDTTGSAIIYYILLNDDSQNVKDEFLECLNVFDDFGFDDKIKVLIRFIPVSFTGKITFKNEIIFK